MSVFPLSSIALTQTAGTPSGGPQEEGRAAMTDVRYRDYYGSILVIFLVSRVASEIINTFVWYRANYLWSLCALWFIGALFPALLVMLARRKGKILVDYLPVLAYLLFLLARTNFSNLYSMKSFFSEFIIWFCFISTVEICTRNPTTSKRLQTAVVWAVKIIVVIGVGQLAFFLIRAGSPSPTAVLELRPVQGIFVHPNIYLVVVLPFSFFFIKQRSYVWTILSILTCVGTGARSPFLAALCIFIPVFKSAFRRPITRVDIGVTFLIIVVTYSILIKLNSYGWDWQNVDSRMTLGTMQWRVDHWRSFLENNERFSSWFGHGVGSADLFKSASRSDRPSILPHNDYVRIYYDIGFLGLLIFLNLVFFMVRLLMRSITVDNDFILLIYLVIICFYITDNFVYVTHSVWVYMFVASFLTIPSARIEGKPN